MKEFQPYSPCAILHMEEVKAKCWHGHIHCFSPTVRQINSYIFKVDLFLQGAIHLPDSRNGD